MQIPHQAQVPRVEEMFVVWDPNDPGFLGLLQRALIAFLAISRRRSGESLAALAFPPRLPRATAWGFFFLPIPPSIIRGHGRARVLVPVDCS